MPTTWRKLGSCNYQSSTWIQLFKWFASVELHQKHFVLDWLPLSWKWWLCQDKYQLSWRLLAPTARQENWRNSYIRFQLFKYANEALTLIHFILVPWNIQSRVQNRNELESKCLQLNIGVNSPPENTFTRQPCQQKSKSFICEHHSYAGVCSNDSNNEKSVPNDLFIHNEAKLNWHMARLECRNKGAGWDLVIIESQSKLDFITNWTDCGTTYLGWIRRIILYWSSLCELNHYGLEPNQLRAFRLNLGLLVHRLWYSLYRIDSMTGRQR